MRDENRTSLKQETEDARDVLAALRAALLYQEDEDIDDAVKLDTLEGETDVLEMIDRAIEEDTVAKAQQEALAELIRKMQARKARLKNRAEMIRTALAVTLEVIEEKKLQRPMATVSLPKARKAVEIDPDHEHELPDEFLEVVTPDPVVKILDKELIAALKDGREVTGCRLVDKPRTVSIRVV